MMRTALIGLALVALAGCSLLPDYSDNYLKAEARGPLVGNGLLKQRQLVIPGEDQAQSPKQFDETLVQPPQVITVKP